MSYGIAIGILSINTAITFVYVFNILIGQYFQYVNILPHVGTVQTFASTTDPLFIAYSASSIVSFIATWFATTLLLRHYSKKLGKAKYWIVISIPLVYFLSQFQFMGLSAYLLLVGIYSSAVSVAHDVELRKIVRAFATKEFRLLDSIGTAYMEKEIQKKVIDITSRNQDAMKEQTGIATSLDEDDVKQYLEEVLKEVENMRK